MSFLKTRWYCAAWVHEVTQTPMVRTILGTPVLLFRDSDGKAIALGDRCPHRFAPLHKGTVLGDRIRCAYHGLEFDRTGICAHNPHGRGLIPPTLRVPSFPLVERQHVLWIWMGDPADAGADTILDLQFVGDADNPLVAGYIHMNSNYQLVTDNLLDLTHAPYLHGDDVAPQTATRESSFKMGDDWVESRYITRSVPAPGLMRPFFSASEGDHFTRMSWTAPAMLRQIVAMSEKDVPPQEGAILSNVHLLTPETEDSTHYFWGTKRNRRVGDESIDAALRKAVHKAFVLEDEPMVAACRNYMTSNDLMAMRPVILETDLAAITARRTLKQLMAAGPEQSRNPDTAPLDTTRP